MNPSGTITTAFAPAAGSSAITSLTSGSSHGCAGGPERDWNTSCHGTVSPPVTASTFSMM
jgi:hypothetical protein